MKITVCTEDSQFLHLKSYANRNRHSSNNGGRCLAECLLAGSEQIGGPVSGAGLSFRDAVTLLGGQSRTVAVLDRLTGGLLLAATAGGSSFAISLFDPKKELATLGGELWTQAVQRARGLDRFGRIDRLAAAHAIIVVSAFFDAVGDIRLPFNIQDAGIDRADQTQLAGGSSGGRLSDVVDGLLRTTIPLPSPERPYEAVLMELKQYYRALSANLIAFLSGLAIWDALSETEREKAMVALRDEAPHRATARYNESFHRLAIEMPEVSFWSNSIDHQATRYSVRQIENGLVRLETLITELSSGRTPDERRHALSRLYRTALTRPILSGGDVPAGITIPTLEQGYITPAFRAAAVRNYTDLASEDWWAKQPVREDLEDFLIGHLTSRGAARVPLLILGQPGSGKSVLTRVLAARLPANDFLVIRVLLREVPADGDLQAHIEYAIRASTGEPLSWPQFAQSRGDAMPLLLLDGFDELLQATGVNQTDYLERIAAFQQREATMGRPVAAFVTTRTAVADRARCVSGTVAIRLEPFSIQHVERWVACWNDANAATLIKRGLEPVSVEVLMANPDLASQPLLLMMLALYDADDNALRKASSALGRVELYEQLLTRFAEREIRKTGSGMTDEQLTQEVQNELTRLSVVAFAMFNRGRQWTTVGELDRDLPVLLPSQSPPVVAPRGDLRAELSQGQRALGRFFFVHQGSATRDGSELRTFEFLHATFGEFLVGWLVARELSDMADILTISRNHSRPGEVDDAFLHALLSFIPLTMRSTAVSFLDEQLRHWTTERREILREPIIRLFRLSQHRPRSSEFSAYQPIPATVPALHATYSCNLLLLLLMLTESIRASDLMQGGESAWFIQAADPHFRWRNMALLWRSQLPSEGWHHLIESIQVERIVTDRRTDVQVQLVRQGTSTWNFDPEWMYWGELGRTPLIPPYGWKFLNADEVFNYVHFVADRRIDMMAHALAPFKENFLEALTAFASLEPGQAQSAANTLLKLWLDSSLGDDPSSLQRLYYEGLRMAEWAFSPHAPERTTFFKLVLRQLAVDRNRLADDWLDTYLTEVKKLLRSGIVPNSEQLERQLEIFF
jgi:NACHT N-terminal Helical domain 7